MVRDFVSRLAEKGSRKPAGGCRKQHRSTTPAKGGPVMMRLSGFLILAIVLMSASAFADTTWVGRSDLSGDWSNAGSPYIIQGDIHIAPLDTLKIGPGVVVFFSGAYHFTIEGVLLAIGDASDSVIFTADTVANINGWGGLRFVRPSGDSHLTYTLVEHGQALASGDFGYGGGIYCVGTDLQMNSCTVRWCRATSGQGIYLAGSSFVTMTHCEISGNGSLSGFGGGFYCRDQSTLTMSDCLVERNIAAYGGGGAIDLAHLTIDRCTVTKNSAGVSGGGFYSTGAIMTATHSTFLANNSIGGGAIDGRYQLDLSMDHCLIESNLAMRQGASGPGGGLALGGGRQQIVNCTFVNNAAGQGGAVYMGSGTQLVNCIFAYQANGGCLEFPFPDAVVQYCCFAGNAGGDINGTLSPLGLGIIGTRNMNGDSCDQYRNLFLNPQFDDSSSYPYRLAPGSPCINAGDPTDLHDPDGTVADIGAYYFDERLKARELFTAEPTSFRISAFPNPFNPATTLQFEVPQVEFVSLRIFDMLGRQVATLVNERKPAGSYSVNWNASLEPSGTYFGVLESGGTRNTQKLLLLK